MQKSALDALKSPGCSCTVCGLRHRYTSTVNKRPPGNSWPNNATEFRSRNAKGRYWCWGIMFEGCCEKERRFGPQRGRKSCDAKALSMVWPMTKFMSIWFSSISIRFDFVSTFPCGWFVVDEIYTLWGWIRSVSSNVIKFRKLNLSKIIWNNWQDIVEGDC